MRLSIIIPVYKAEKTLDRCIESILGQEFTDYEIILVDDGSPDLCPQLCDGWAGRDEHIRVIHKSNGGPGDARNAGIAAAEGEYLTFIDSDDTIAPNTLLPLMETIEKQPGIQILEYPVEVKGKWNFTPEERSYSDIDAYWTESRAYEHTFSCNKIFVKDLFNGIEFPTGRMVGEDAWIFPQLLRKAASITTTNKGCYIYFDNPESVSATADGEQLRRLLEIHLSDGMPTDTAYFAYLLNIQLDVFRNTGDILLKDDFPALIGEANSLILKLKLILYKLLGIKRLCKLHKILKSLL